MDLQTAALMFRQTTSETPDCETGYAVRSRLTKDGKLQFPLTACDTVELTQCEHGSKHRSKIKKSKSFVQECSIYSFVCHVHQNIHPNNTKRSDGDVQRTDQRKPALLGRR